MVGRELVYFMGGRGLVRDLRRVQFRYPWGCRFRYGLARPGFGRRNGMRERIDDYRGVCVVGMLWVQEEQKVHEYPY